jgi:hypothetical protein
MQIMDNKSYTNRTTHTHNPAMHPECVAVVDAHNQQLLSAVNRRSISSVEKEVAFLKEIHDYLSRRLELLYAKVDARYRHEEEDNIQALYKYALKRRKELVTPAMRKELIAVGAYRLKLSVTPPKPVAITPLLPEMLPETAFAFVQAAVQETQAQVKATKSLPIEEQSEALEALALEHLCSEGMLAINLCAYADSQEGIDEAKAMYNEAQELARGLGYFLVCQPCNAENPAQGDWKLVAMKLVAA